MLSVHNHDRDIVHLTYVYPVVSRRAKGVSLGINLNPNNKCNWQCIYCQVPNLQRGVGDAIDLKLLRHELDVFLDRLISGSYMQENVPEGCRVLKDLAISGNGEPTTCPNFDEVVSLIIVLIEKYNLDIPLRLITNGSSVHKPHVQVGLMRMAKQGGEVWFKVDAVGEAATMMVNQVSLSMKWQLEQLRKSAETCPTWVQTCILDGVNASGDVWEDYLSFLNQIVIQNIPIKGVFLYSLARPSHQSGGDDLVEAGQACLQELAQKIESLGLTAKVS